MNHPLARIVRVIPPSLVGCVALAAATIPANAASPGKTEPFQVHLIGTSTNGFFCGASYTVPAGVHVHVSYVAFRGDSHLSGQITTGGEFDVSPPFFQTYMNPLQGNYSFGETLFTGGQAIVAEADPGSVITVGYYFAQIESNLGCEVALSGHLETVL
jgi:hypothetical protein